MSENERKTWIMYKRAIPAYTEGMTRHLSGATAPEENKWYDSLGSGKALTLASGYTYDPKTKLYSIPRSSSMNIAQTRIPCTIEYVFRNLKGTSCTYSGSSSWGDIIRRPNNTGLTQSIQVHGRGETFACLWVSSSAQGGYKTFKPAQYGITDNDLTTISISSTHCYINGQLHMTYTSNTLTCTTENIIFNPSSTFKVYGIKMHDIRFYPSVLTEEQVIHNHEVDKLIYGA